MVNLKKSQSHRNKELVGGCQGLGSRGNGEMLVKGCKLLVIRYISSMGLVYSMVTVVNNTILYT